MKKAALIFLGLIVLFAVGFFAAPGLKSRFTRDYKKGFDESFRASFTQSFIEACAKNNPQMVCGCVVNQALAQLTVTQLQDQKFTLDYMQKNLLPGCVDAYKRGTTTSRGVKGG